MKRKSNFEEIFKQLPPESEEISTDISSEQELLPEEIQEEIEKLSAPSEEVQKIKTTNPISISSDFNTGITEVGYEFLATGERNVVTVSNGKIYMLQGRQYYIPVNVTDIDSDNYNIKVYSEAADRFDVRYIRDGLAAIVPIRHNTILRSGERLCVLTALNL